MFIMTRNRPYRRVTIKIGFTLIEMMAATAVLAIMIAMLAPIFSTVASSTTNSAEKLEVDVLARQALDRIGRDLAMMPKQQGLDYYLNKIDVGGSSEGNDEFDFFSKVPGVLPSGTDPATDPASGITLVSYRVNDGNLERMAIAQPFSKLTFITYDESNSIVAGTGVTQAVAGTTLDDYHILCKGVFRFELGFLLTDGTYETLPMDLSKNPASNTEPGWREWNNTAPHSFAEILAQDGTGVTSFNPLGWQDVSAIVVSLAVIDPANGNRASINGLKTAAQRLPDAVADDTLPELNLPTTAWRDVLKTPGSLGLPQDQQNAVKIYQRMFYLNTQ